VNAFQDDLQRRLAAAESWANRIQRDRPNDHRAIALAWAHVRRLKAALRGAVK
jgi:hypothetical protein